MREEQWLRWRWKIKVELLACKATIVMVGERRELLVCCVKRREIKKIINEN